MNHRKQLKFVAGTERDVQYKTHIFEQLFQNRGGAAGLAAEPDKARVTLDEVRAQIAEYNARNGSRGHLKNVAAFFKDFVRNIDNANRYWPLSVRNEGFTARQMTGAGTCFAFERFPDGQMEPFRKFEPSLGKGATAIEVSLSEVPRSIIEFADNSDRWLGALCATLGIVQKHFASASLRRAKRMDVDEAFLGIRGKYAAIDRLYVGRNSSSKDRSWLIPTEVKFKDDIYDVQMASLGRELQESSVIKGLRRRGHQFLGIIPLAVKWLQRRHTGIGFYQALAGNQIYVVEFDAIGMNQVPPAHPIVNAESVFNIVN